ncbi:MAG: serine/threonine-protein kinase [Mariniblastus sp.]|nr:serine/threonine-protein kinase [Mariniblastus sp.]
MKVRLNVVSGPAKGRFFDIDENQALVIGRGEQSDTRINDPSVSRVHCEVRVQPDQITLVDKGSSSGTFVDGQAVEELNIQKGCLVRIGDTELRVADPHEEAITEVIQGLPEIPASSHSLPQLVGSQMGPYMLEEIIGSGNSGMVFRGSDTEKGRQAAIKVLSPSYTSNDEQRQRFVRAMKTMLPVRSERIIRLYNAGKTGDFCWAAMELIEGENLAEEIERIGIEGMLDWRKVWRVAVDIGQALNDAYDCKIIHRNVTPMNIIRRKSDEACLLGDLMLAKALEGTLAQQVTQPGQIIGDIPYLAPERTRSDATVDTRSDMYGLGATCYALLTGTPPISGDGLTELVANVRTELPKSPKSFQLAVDDLFQDVVMKLLAKEPEDRFATPAELLKELLKIGKFNNLDPGF